VTSSLSTPLRLPGRHGGVIALLGAAALVRLVGLSDWWLNPDEGIYYSVLTRAEFAGFWREAMENAHPPLYYLILRSLSLVTWDFYWLRVFSVLCGVAAVWGAWAAARELARAGETAAERAGGEADQEDAARGAVDGEGSSGTDGAVRVGVAGLLAALILAFAPGAVALSQVMRPYMLQLALLTWALHFWLRHARTCAARDLTAYITLLCLALLTHYSSILALGVFVAASAVLAGARGFGTPEARRLATSHLLPLALLATLWVLHLSVLADSALADEALDGWLGPYMVHTPGDAWLAFLGFQHLVARPWSRGPMALFLLGAVALSATRRARSVWVFAGGALAVGLTTGALGLYPFGSTRHSTWALAFTVPAIGWLGGTLAEAARDHTGLRRAAPLLLSALMLAFGGPLGSALGMDRAPWAPTDRVLRRTDVARMLGILEPDGEPELVLASAQTFYLLAPFYATDREHATYSADSTVFQFPYGRRRVVVSTAWDFTLADSAASRPLPPGDLNPFLETVEASFPELSVTERSGALILVGGWRPPFVDRLRVVSEAHPFIHSVLSVPGLYAFHVDPGEMAEALESVRGTVAVR
jgi:hypothetical protein